MRAKTFSAYVVTIVVFMTCILLSKAIASDDDLTHIGFSDDALVFEFVGQVTNFGPSPSAPLGSSIQYGYLTMVQGIDNAFSGNPHNETTALLTFFNEATTTASFSDGPLRIIDRNGTTTIYLNSAPANFATPDSFRSGIPIQISKLHQQVIVDTAGGTFSAVFNNTISSTSTFTLPGTTLRLGKEGQVFRAKVTGQLNATPPPAGHIAGYAVGAGREAASPSEQR
jgi:hypothetical protein